MKFRKPKIGDIYEIETPIGLAYFQYTHDGERYGALVRVLPGTYTARPADFAPVADQKELYFIFYNLEFDLRRGKVELVSHQPVPELVKEFPIMRQQGGISREGKTLNWFIGHGLKLGQIGQMHEVMNVRELTPEQKKLSIVILTNYEPLVKDIVRGWTPERDEELMVEEERKKRAAAPPEVQPKQLPTDSALDHFLYFPKKRQAEEAARRLQAKSWQAEVRMGADLKNWLVLAKQPAPIDEDIEEVREELEQLAEDLHGEYDGWGAPLS